MTELFCLILFVLDLLFFQTWILAGASLAYFIYDFARYRREAFLNYRESRVMREQMTLEDIRSIERKYSLRDDFDSFEKHASARPPLDRHFYFAKYERVRELLLPYASKKGLWLDLGCGFGEDVLFIFQRVAEKVVGLELDEIKASTASKRIQEETSSGQVSFSVGDAVHAPFRSRTFDAILMTEVLEHLINPEKGVQSCQLLLKEGGILILSTPSLQNLGYSLNPLFLLEKSLSLLDESVLPRYHSLHARFEYNRKKPEPEYGIHHHFSEQELRRIITQNGFKIVWEGTFEIEIFPYLFIELFSKGNVDRIGKIVQPIERVLERTPLINRFGQHLLLVAEKRP